MFRSASKGLHRPGWTTRVGVGMGDHAPRDAAEKGRAQSGPSAWSQRVSPPPFALAAVSDRRPHVALAGASYGLRIIEAGLLAFSTSSSRRELRATCRLAVDLLDSAAALRRGARASSPLGCHRYWSSEWAPEHMSWSTLCSSLCANAPSGSRSRRWPPPLHPRRTRHRSSGQVTGRMSSEAPAAQPMA